jgi:DivIVA domain-containing protein
VELTPRDIQDKQFHDAFRGYSHEEVDAFLDEVALAFDKMYRANQTLERRIGELEQSGAGGREAEEMLRKTIYSAQRSASEAVEEAQRTAEKLMADAEAKASETIGAAEAKAEEAIGAAEAKASETIRAAEAKAHETVGAAEAKAHEAVSGSEARAGDIVARALATERELQTRIGGLRAFEDEYRARLTGFLESQLRVLSEMEEVQPPPEIAPLVVPRAAQAPRPPDHGPPPQSAAEDAPDAGTVVVTWSEDPVHAGPVVTASSESRDEGGSTPETTGLRVVDGPARTRSSVPTASRPEPAGPPSGPTRRQDDTRPSARSSDGVDEEEHRSITRLFWGGEE